jgi:uncharacterized membrane protein
MSGTPKALWISLAVSVALNLFFLGLAASRHEQFRGRMHEESGPRAFMRHSGLREAGPEVQQVLKQQRQNARDDAHALAQARTAVQKALASEPFDAGLTGAAFAEVRARTTAMQAQMHAVLLEVAAKLNREQRQRMADALWNHGHSGSPMP